jgi:hypothetical protein
MTSTNHEPWFPLEELAAAHNVAITDTWERSTAIMRDGIDVQRLVDLGRSPGFTARLLFDNEDLPLTLQPGAPDGDQLERLKNLLTNERLQAELSTAKDVLDAEHLLHEYLSGAYVQYEQPAWVRTESAFLEVVERDWVQVARAMADPVLHCGEQNIDLEPLEGPSPPGALPVGTLKASQTLPEPLRDALAKLANVSAWTQLAVRLQVEGSAVRAALHQDQDVVVEVEPASSAGAVDLLRWRMSDNQASRDEALRHVLRFVTAGSPRLPSAVAVKTLAERQYIALSRDRAAEVFRAIADAQRSTEDMLETASETLSKLVEDTTTTASATIAAIIGVVALTVKNENLLPSWLILIATVVAVGGVIAVVASRWRRTQDQEDAVARLQKRLEDDPLLPADDQRAMRQLVTEAQLGRRATTARWRIAGLGAAACVVALAAAIWLVAAAPSPSTTTSMTHTAAQPPLPGLGHTPVRRPMQRDLRAA